MRGAGGDTPGSRGAASAARAASAPGVATPDDRRGRPLAEAPEVGADPRLERPDRRRSRCAGRSRGRSETPPRTRATGFARGRGPERASEPGRRRSGSSGCDRDPSRGGWPGGPRGGTPAGARIRPAPPAARPRSDRGSPRGRRAAGPCGGRGSSPQAGPTGPAAGNRSRSEARIAAAPTSSTARARSASSGSAWRCSRPPRWSRQIEHRYDFAVRRGLRGGLPCPAGRSGPGLRPPGSR